jgi:imidazolonepropionase
LGVIQDGAVLIVDGRIQEVGPSRRIENLAAARRAEEIDATGRIVMPSFIDSHTYIASGRPRSSNHAPAIDHSQQNALARAIHELSPRTLQTQALHTVTEALRHGTTTVEGKSGLGLIEANEIKILRTHAALQKLGVPLLSTFFCLRASPEYADRPDEYIERAGSHLLPAVKRRKLAESAEIGCDTAGFLVEQALCFLTAARRLGFRLKLLLGSTARRGAIPAAIKVEATSVDDAIDISPADASLMARSPTIAVILPGPPFFTGSQAPAARAMIDSGVAVALASGYHPESCPSQNMQMMIALACINLRTTPAEAVAAATINAAYAVGRASQIGSLEAGKKADLLILSAPDYREMAYHFGVNLVELVMKSGEVMIRRSEVQWPVR